MKAVPYEIPKKWKWVTLSSIASLLNGRAYSKNELLDDAPGRTPVLRVGNFFTNGSWYYSDLKLDSNKYCDNGDLLFAWSASFGPKIWNGGKCIYHYHIWKVICSKSVDKEWLYFWLLAMSERLKSSSGRGSTMIHITKRETEQVPLALPPIEEQRRIVKRLYELKKLVEIYQREEKELVSIEATFPEKLRASILQDAIQGRLVPQLESEPVVTQIGTKPHVAPFIVPDKWKWVQLKAVGKVIGGGTPRTNVPEYWDNGDIPWFTPADLGKVTDIYVGSSARKITAKGLANSSAITMPKNSVLFSSRAPIGYIALAKENCCTNQGCKSFIANESVIVPMWAYWVLKARTPDIVSRASGTTFKEISGRGMGDTWIPLPPIAEQNRIITKIKELFDIAKVLQ